MKISLLRLSCALLIVALLALPMLAFPRTAAAVCTWHNAAGWTTTVRWGTGSVGTSVTSAWHDDEGNIAGDPQHDGGIAAVDVHFLLPVAVNLRGVRWESKQTGGVAQHHSEAWTIIGLDYASPSPGQPQYNGSNVDIAHTANGFSPAASAGAFEPMSSFTGSFFGNLDEDHDWAAVTPLSEWNYPGIYQIFVSGKIALQFQGGESPPQPSATLELRNLEFCTDTSVPTSTPTMSLTPTPTLSPTPGLPGLPTAPRCDLISRDVATFETLNAWDISSPNSTHPPGATQGLKLPNGYAELILSLDPQVQYSIYLEFHRTQSLTGGVFNVALGKEPAFRVDIDSDENGTQVFETPPGNFTPNDSVSSSPLYRLTITAGSPWQFGDPGLVLDFICVQVNSEGSGGGSGSGSGEAGGGGLFGGGIQQTACQQCEYAPIGDLFHDIPHVIEWLWCGLSQLFDCVLRNVLYGLWQTIVRIIQIIAFLRLWAGLIIERAIGWVIGNLGVLANWVGGHIINIITAIGTPIVSFFSNFINAVLTLLGGIWGFLQQVITGIGMLISAGGTLIATGFQFIASIVEQIWNLATQAIGIIPTLLVSLIVGLTTGAEAIPAWAPSCNNPGSLLFYPCLGMFILDNTIFLGPVYYLIPVVIAVVSWRLILWGIREFRGALAGK